MNWSIDSVGKQTGRVAIVTGANIGLGLSTAMALAGKGCSVVLACRNATKAAEAKAQILEAHRNAKVSVLALDLCSLKSVRKFATDFTKKHQRLDLLINNAGIMVPPYQLSEDGFESQLAANYLGHFVLTGLLLPLLNKTPGARIVCLSSLAHVAGRIRFDDMNFTRGYNKFAAYAQSKLACLMFAYELGRRVRAHGGGTLVVAAHPGLSATNLVKYFPGPMIKLAPLVAQSADNGALPTLYAALGEDIESGDYCGPTGLAETRGAPVKVKSTPASRNLAAASRLWALSEKMTGTSYLS